MILQENVTKKVLIITYYWPPAGGPGVQRWLKFVKYLPEFQIEPIVFVPKNPDYPIIDDILKNEVSEDVIIYRHPIFEPYGIASLFSSKKLLKASSGIIPKNEKLGLLDKLLLWIRGNLFIPDARIFWVKPAVKRIKKILNQHQIEVIITTGPPHSVHLIGLELKKQLPIFWLADFRDPWTTIGYHKDLLLSPFAEKKHKALEKKVLNAADKIIVTSNSTKVEFQKTASTPISVITNGYDDEFIDEIILDKKFTLVHVGSLLSERNPLNLWKALYELKKENISFSQDFELHFYGKVSEEVLLSITQAGLKDYVRIFGYVSHNEAVKAQRQAQVLLLIEIDKEDTKVIIPGKIFEYLISTRPIIALGPKEADFKTILEKTNTGYFFQYDEIEAIKLKISDLYNDYKKGNLGVEPINVEQYHRKNLTQQLANLIKTTT